MSKPLIIWTFRRTGGTNLASYLFESSEFNTIQHEPFNIDRQHGDLLASWKSNADEDELREGIHQALSQRVNIKHCLEMVPGKFNQILAEEAVNNDYQHLFLFRNRGEDRLLSLNFAQQTDIWGKEQKNKVIEVDFSTPVNVEGLLAHERRCQRQMELIFERLLDMGELPFSVSFEMLYRSEFQIASQYVKDIVEGLGIDRSLLTDDTLEDLLQGGAQGTKEKYLSFPRADELIIEASKLPDFSLNSVPESTLEYTIKSDSVLHFEIWSSLPSVYYGQIHLHGVCLLENGDSLSEVVNKRDGTSINFIKLNSDRIYNMYPNKSSSKLARFLTIKSPLASFLILDNEKNELVEVNSNHN